MNRTLKSGDVVELDGVVYAARLNGSTVYLHCGSRRISVSRNKAERLPRIKRANGESMSVTSTMSESSTSATSTTTTALAPAPTTDAKRHRLRELLKKNCVTDVDLEKLCDDVLVALGEGSSKGGVYLIQIVEVAGKLVKFWRNGKETDEFVLVKFGKADVYADRFRQFKFKFNVTMKVDGNTTMESALKRTIPANWKSYFFDASKKNTTVLKEIGCQGNNGPSEWRIMRRTTHDDIKQRADAGLINSLNWSNQLKVANPLEIKEKEITMQVGAISQLVNSIMFQVY